MTAMAGWTALRERCHNGALVSRLHPTRGQGPRVAMHSARAEIGLSLRGGREP